MEQISKDSGFTLLELTMAVAMTSLGIVALLAGLVRTNAANQYAQERATVVDRVSTVADELSRATTADLLAYAPPAFQGTVPSTQIQVVYVNADGNEAPPTAFTAATLPNPLEVHLTVNAASLTGHPINLQTSTVIGRD